MEDFKSIGKQSKNNRYSFEVFIVRSFWYVQPKWVRWNESCWVLVWSSTFLLCEMILILNQKRHPQSAYGIVWVVREYWAWAFPCLSSTLLFVFCCARRMLIISCTSLLQMVLLWSSSIPINRIDFCAGRCRDPRGLLLDASLEKIYVP